MAFRIFGGNDGMAGIYSEGTLEQRGKYPQNVAQNFLVGRLLVPLLGSADADIYAALGGHTKYVFGGAI